MGILNFIKKYQLKLVLLVGYILVACFGFLLGRLVFTPQIKPAITIEEVFVPVNNYTPIVSGIQSNPLTCDGKVKGSASKVYHLPGGSFYNRVTNPERCFQTEAEAIESGFRKSSR